MADSKVLTDLQFADRLARLSLEVQAAVLRETMLRRLHHHAEPGKEPPIAVLAHYVWMFSNRNTVENDVLIADIEAAFAALEVSHG